VALPGGHVDPSDATSLDAAYRELYEELGIPRERIDLVGGMGHFQTINCKDIEVFVGAWDGRGTLNTDPTEVARVLEIPLAEVIAHHRFEKEPIDPVYPFDDVRIWGATARILHYFIDLVSPYLEKR
jgi:8-oxo-dGTP pyrophosphatase MutT (NUDIX family)